MDKRPAGSSDGRRLQVLTQPLDLIDEEVDVGLSDRGVGDDHSEEVDVVALRLVAHHGGP